MLPNSSCLRSPGSTIILLLLLSSCANTPVGESLQRSLEADPQLQENNPDLVSTATPTQPPSVELPEDFPDQIPKYEGAELIEVEELSQSVESSSSDIAEESDNKSTDNKSAEEIESPPAPSANTPAPEKSETTETPPVPPTPKIQTIVSTRWQTDDTEEQVKNFYQSEFQENQWEFIEQPTENKLADGPDKVVVRQGDLEVTVATIQVPDGEKSEDKNPTPLPTQYLIEYHRIDPESTSEIASETGSKSDSESTSESTSKTASKSPSKTASKNAIADDTDDIDRTPEPLREYIRDLAKLGLFQNMASPEHQSTADKFLEPNKTITRRNYAQWLIQANNQIYANEPSKQIRLATTETQPAFKDVPTTDPDFPAIQGLAEAGIIPSTLSGESTSVTFSPDKPLTRQDLILWKVPLDNRRSLPTASLDAVKDTWGFQDASKIDPKALRAVLADYQNGDLSNIRRTFGYTTLFQPQKTVTRAEAAAVLWYFGISGDGRSANDALDLKASQSNE